MPIYSYDRYTGDGGTKDFTISFDYLSSTHIDVSLDAVVQTTGFTLDTGTNKCTFDTAPGDGVIVLLQRSTPKTKALYQAQIADFADGSVLTEQDLDNAVLGLLYISQEAEDAGSTNSINKDLADDVWDADNIRIKDLATPTAALDAVTKQYVDGLALYDAPSTPQKWSFSGDAAETDFTLTTPGSIDVNMYVIDIDGVMQKPTTDFTISGVTLTFVAAPASGTNNITVRNFGVARDILAQPVIPDAVGNVGLTVKGLAGQTANLQNWTDSGDVVKANVDKDGNIGIGITPVSPLTIKATGGGWDDGIRIKASDNDANYWDIIAAGDSNGLRMGYKGTEKFRIDLDGNITAIGDLDVTGDTTLAGGVTGAMAATGAVSGTTITGSGAISGTTITGSAGITGTTGTFSSDVGVTGDLNLVTGALQYAGVAAMSLRQVVSGTFSGSEHVITSTTDHMVYGLSTTITPKSTSSVLVVVWKPRINNVATTTTTVGHVAYISTGNTAAAGAIGDGTLVPYSHDLNIHTFDDSGTDNVFHNSSTNVTIHSPATTSAITYDVVVRAYGSGTSSRCYPTAGSSAMWILEFA
jgi:hypothetical protein